MVVPIHEGSYTPHRWLFFLIRTRREAFETCFFLLRHVPRNPLPRGMVFFVAGNSLFIRGACWPSRGG